MEVPVDIVIEDEEGYKSELIEFCGRIHPRYKDYKTIFPMLKSIQARSDDILIVTYPKSGTTWCRWLVNELIRGPLDGRLWMPGFIENTKQDALDLMESPRILYTHLTPDVMSTDFLKKKCKIVFVVRNIKDVLVSLYGHVRGITHNKYNGNFSGFVNGEIRREGQSGSWFEYLRTWEAYFNEHPEVPALILQYEDMKQNCFRDVKKLRDFLHLSRDDAFWEQVVQRCSFGNMQTRDQQNPMIPHEVWRDNKSVFFRKGEVGDWKNWYTVAQSERIDKIFDIEMKGSKFRLKYDL